MVLFKSYVAIQRTHWSLPHWMNEWKFNDTLEQKLAIGCQTNGINSVKSCTKYVYHRYIKLKFKIKLTLLNTIKCMWFHHISFTKYVFPFPSKMIALHQNVANCQNILTALTLRWRIFPQDVWMGQMCMTDVGTTQDNFILPAPPVGGLPTSQDRLDKMKLVYDCTIPVILPSGKNILVNMLFKISIGYTNLNTMQIQSRLGSRVYLMPIWLGTQRKIMSLLAQIKKTLLYHYPNQGMFQLHIL